MDDHDSITESFFGVLFGALAGLGLLWWLDGPLFFTGDVVLIGTVLGGVVGYLWGHEIVVFFSHLFGP